MPGESCWRVWSRKSYLAGGLDEQAPRTETMAAPSSRLCERMNSLPPLRPANDLVRAGWAYSSTVHGGITEGAVDYFGFMRAGLAQIISLPVASGALRLSRGHSATF